MIMLLVVVGFVYSWSRDPRNWEWINAFSLAQKEEQKNGTKMPVIVPSPETVVPGANDQSPAELEDARMQLDAVSDGGTKLAEYEMPAYWRLMRWARTQPFAELEKRADGNVTYAELHDNPDKYRGKLIRLRMHVRRVLTHPGYENSAGVKEVYEATGATDDSKSLLLMCIFSELPPGMKTGDTVFEEGLFVGYFLKNLHTVNGKGQSFVVPVLVGRMANVRSPQAAGGPVSDWNMVWIAAVAGVVVLAAAVVVTLKVKRKRRKPLPSASATSDEQVHEWLAGQSAGED